MSDSTDWVYIEREFGYFRFYFLKGRGQNSELTLVMTRDTYWWLAKSILSKWFEIKSGGFFIFTFLLKCQTCRKVEQ